MTHDAFTWRDLLTLLAIVVNVLIVPYLRNTMDLAMAKVIERVADKFATREELKETEARLEKQIGVEKSLESISKDVRFLVKQDPALRMRT
jgi:hypothetical protein